MAARRNTPPDQASVDPWTSLQRHWEHQARSAHGSVILDWAARAPGLANFDSPLEVTATIRSLGDPERSWALLAELLVIAHLDSLAGEAVLVALIPGLRAASNRRWRVARGAGPWCDQFELDMDTINAAWETISRAAGQRHASGPVVSSFDPSNRQLRTRHEAHCQTANRSVSLIEAGNTSISRLADQNTIHHAVAVVQAVRSGLLDPTSRGAGLSSRRWRCTPRFRRPTTWRRRSSRPSATGQSRQPAQRPTAAKNRHHSHLQLSSGGLPHAPAPAQRQPSRSAHRGQTHHRL